MYEKRMIEIKNIECSEYCLLDIDTGEKSFYNSQRKYRDFDGKFTGLYYFESYSNLFFALLPTSEGPVIYYKNRIYNVTDKLKMEYQSIEDGGIFRILDYNISIKYKDSKYLNIDTWSSKEDIDIFYYIFFNYRKKTFYEIYSQNVFI